MEDAGIEPATFRMQSGRSTNWANPPIFKGGIAAQNKNSYLI